MTSLVESSSSRNSLLQFFKLESFGGILLFFTAVLAILLVNSPFSSLYATLQEVPVKVQVGELIIDKPLLLWVNDGLMAIFFLLIGLELKREVVEGHLSSMKQVILPMSAAVGGILIPALIYTAFNYSSGEQLRGWAIPAATDIAFALGVLALFGKRVPISLKIFLTAVAIFDDIAAILIIAIFYTYELSFTALLIAAVFTTILYALNVLGVKKYIPYFVVGLLLWICVLKSGVHATLAGVVLALMIPFSGKEEGDKSPVVELEHALHPWVAYGVLPVFAFLNAGVSLSGIGSDVLFHPLTLGIALGLFVGKQAGALGGAYLAVKWGIAQLPQGVSWHTLYGVCLLSGIGFTMSLFIGTLAYESPEMLTLVRLGVISGSILSAGLGIVILALYLSPEEHKEELPEPSADGE